MHRPTLKKHFYMFRSECQYRTDHIFMGSPQARNDLTFIFFNVRSKIEEHFDMFLPGYICYDAFTGVKPCREYVFKYGNEDLDTITVFNDYDNGDEEY